VDLVDLDLRRKAEYQGVLRYRPELQVSVGPDDEIGTVAQLQQARNTLDTLLRYICHVESPSMKSLDPQSMHPV
jgi:hypothetical protein